MDLLAGDEALKALDRVQVELVTSFLGECCVASQTPEDERLWYVTYDTGPASLRSAFRQWLVDKGHSLVYELPSSWCAASSPLKRLIGLYLKREVHAKQVKHRYHGVVSRGAYRGVRLASIDPVWYHHPPADTRDQGATVGAAPLLASPIGARSISLHSSDLVLVDVLACLQW